MTFSATRTLAFGFLTLLMSFAACTPGGRPIEALDLSASAYELPSATFAKNGFFAASIDKLGTLIGDDSGLFHLSNNKLSNLDENAVVGLSPWRGAYILIAGKNQLMIFDGALQTLPLEEKLKLKETEITSIAAQQKDILWIGTKAHLWRLKNDTLEAFDTIKNIKQVSTFVGSNEVVIRNDKDELTVLRTDASGQVETLQMPADAPSFQHLLPGLEDGLWGLSDKKLYWREKQEQQTRWVPYLLGDANAEQSAPIEHFTVDNSGGQVWAITATDLFSVVPQKVLRAKRPETLTTINAVAATGDGGLWVSDGKKLHQFVRQKTENITYEGQVSLFMKDNCWRCHEQAGPGRPLNTYDLTKQNIDSIIQQVETGAMPADKQPLTNGDVTLLKQWVKNNFAQ